MKPKTKQPKVKKYVEVKSKKPFDWKIFLNKKEYSAYELSTAEDLSQDWVTCACGNACSIIPRDEFGQPDDHVLEDIGVEFSKNISAMFAAKCGEKDIKKYQTMAKKTLAKIEKRSSQLILKEIKEISKKLTEAGIKHEIG